MYKSEIFGKSDFVVCHNCLRKHKINDSIRFVDARDGNTMDGVIVVYNHGFMKQKAVEYKAVNIDGVECSRVIFPENIERIW